jgi:hypothetical protein
LVAVAVEDQIMAAVVAVVDSSNLLLSRIQQQFPSLWGQVERVLSMGTPQTLRVEVIHLLLALLP